MSTSIHRSPGGAEGLRLDGQIERLNSKSPLSQTAFKTCEPLYPPPRSAPQIALPRRRTHLTGGSRRPPIPGRPQPPPPIPDEGVCLTRPSRQGGPNPDSKRSVSRRDPTVAARIGTRICREVFQNASARKSSTQSVFPANPLKPTRGFEPRTPSLRALSGCRRLSRRVVGRRTNPKEFVPPRWLPKTDRHRRVDPA